MSENICWLCKNPGSLRCENCTVYACTSNHIGAHYTIQEGKQRRCRPIRVVERPGAGNCLVATRNIKQGEVILQEYPALVSPSLVSAPVCLDCLNTWKGDGLCTDCGFPVCNKDCQMGVNHIQECGILSQLVEKPVFQAEQRSNPALALVGVIRFMEIATRDPDLAERMGLLMDHVEDIMGSPDLCNMWEGTAVQSLVHGIPNSPYTKQEILRAVGVLHTNSVSGMGKGHALYTTFSLTNHSCICNARFQIYPDRSILLRAQVDIAEGSEITTQYLTPLIGTMPRRMKIRKNWFFDCTCDRCSDPTEKGTYLSGVLCRNCKGVVLPIQPLNYQTVWKCNECSEEINGVTMQTLMDSLQEDMDAIDPLDIDSMQEKLNSWRKILHSHHYLNLQLKRNILGCLKVSAGTETPSRKVLGQQVVLAEENIHVFEVLDPGLTILKGRMLQHLNGPKLEIAKLDLKLKRISRLEFLQATAASIQNVRLATSCFEDYNL